MPSRGRDTRDSQTWEHPWCCKSFIRRCYVTIKAGPGLRPSCARLSPASRSPALFVQIVLGMCHLAVTLTVFLAHSLLLLPFFFKYLVVRPFLHFLSSHSWRSDSTCSESHHVRPCRWDKEVYCCFDGAEESRKAGLARRAHLGQDSVVCLLPCSRRLPTACVDRRTPAS